jgi:IS30 family transposase
VCCPRTVDSCLPFARGRVGHDTGGARRDFAWPGHGALDPADRGHTWSRPVDRQPENPSPWGALAYRAAEADTQAWAHTRRLKPCRLATFPLLQQIAASKLALEWSPAQVAGWLKLEFPDQDTMRVSHETIYRSLFIQARGVLKKELIGHLRSRRRMRWAQCASTAGQPRGQIVDGLSIRDRPADVDDRAIPGHWEGDLITGSQNTHIATLVGRQSHFAMLVKVLGKIRLAW